MKFGFVKVGTFVPEIKVCDTEYNAEEIKRGITLALKNNVEILAFPELSITGATCGDLYYSDTLLNAALASLKKVAEFTKDINMLVFLGLPLKKDGKIYDVCAAVNNGNILGFVPREVISGAFDEYSKSAFSAFDGEDGFVYLEGKEIPFGNIVFKEKTFGYGVGVIIGADLFTEIPRELSLSGASVIVHPFSLPELIGSEENMKVALKDASMNGLTAIVSVNAGAGESTTDEVYGGFSAGYECGKPLFNSPAFNTGLSVSEIDTDFIAFSRSRRFKGEGSSDAVTVEFSASGDGELTRKYPKTPFVPTDETERNIRCEKILELQAQGLKKRLEHTGAKKIVLGLSGGLDSTLALLVAERAALLSGLTVRDIITCTMPCFGTSSRTFENTIRLSKAFGTTLKKIDITKAVERHLKDIKHDKSTLDAAFENAQARERTQVLLDVANMENGLAIGTGDMSEIALGWATYNGDHMSMYGVNCTVTKTLVRAIVETQAEKRRGKIKAVLCDILDTPVSPELLPAKDGDISQKTENIVGPYILHDFFLYHLIGRGSSPRKVYYLAEKTFKGEYDGETVKKWLKTFIRRFIAQQFKRSCSPDGVRVGSVDLSPRGALKMPSDAAATVWLKELESI
ncbi:MAG: NAD(+) synthase [Clostridia bacterium]|nr:NAD(+) synthase [Clostridia bacterium]